MKLLDVNYRKLKEEIVDSCTRCSGRGRELSAEDSETLVLSDCDCLVRLRWIVALFVAGIPKRYHDLELKDFADKDNKAYLKILEISVRLKEMCKEGLGMYLDGGNGVGKSYLAACLLKQAFREDLKGVFIPLEKLVSLTYQSYQDETVKEWLATLPSLDLLVLDEVEKVHISASGRESSMINSLISDLYNNSVSLIVTANCSKKKLPNLFGRAVADRFDEMLLEISFTHSSFREVIREATERKVFGP